MVNDVFSSNEKKVLNNIGDCIKVNIPALAEKTGLSKPTVRNIVNKFIDSKQVVPIASMSPAALGMKLMTIYEVTYPGTVAAQGNMIEKHIAAMLPFSPNIAGVIKINPTQALVISFYTSLDHKDYAFSRTMSRYLEKVGSDFPMSTKELWTRPVKDFYHDPNISKFLKGMEEFKQDNTSGG